MAQWQLGLMYESGEGVAEDKAKAFGYFAEIANEHADGAPRGIEADIVAHSFVKIGDYYKDGLPEAGIAKDEDYSIKLLLHAATYFGDADAQYRVGELYLDDKDGLGHNPVQSARWFSLAAKKGHAAAQAKLGDILFNGDGELKANPVEGLMWLSIASRLSVGTTDADWIGNLLNQDMSVATPDERKQALAALQIAANTLRMSGARAVAAAADGDVISDMLGFFGAAGSGTTKDALDKIKGMASVRYCRPNDAPIALGDPN